MAKLGIVKSREYLYIYWHISLTSQISQIRIKTPPPLIEQKRVLILDIDGVILTMFYNEFIPAWAKKMRMVWENDTTCHIVRPDVEVYINFCFQCFEVWIYTCHKLIDAQHILCICFPSLYGKFKNVLGQGMCQRAPFCIYHKQAYYKNLTTIWQIPEFFDLNGDNTLIFDDTPCHVMWNMQGSYLVFPKMYKQCMEVKCFLVTTMIRWLCGWLSAKDRREYKTWKTLVNVDDYDIFKVLKVIKYIQKANQDAMKKQRP